LVKQMEYNMYNKEKKSLSSLAIAAAS
jgi:hypothetical protein